MFPLKTTAFIAISWGKSTRLAAEGFPAAWECQPRLDAQGPGVTPRPLPGHPALAPAHPPEQPGQPGNWQLIESSRNYLFPGKLPPWKAVRFGAESSI